VWRSEVGKIIAKFVRIGIVVGSVSINAGPSFAQEDTDNPQVIASEKSIRAAASRSINLFKRSSVRYLKERKCPSCHHQTMSLMVFKTARRAGFKIDNLESKRQVERVSGFYNTRRARFESEVVKLPITPVGYHLWSLDLGGHQPDDLTKVMTTALLKNQNELGHWKRRDYRPPASATSFTSNYVAIRALNRYGTTEQKEQIAIRAAAVRNWIDETSAHDTEDQVFRLRLAYELKLPPEKRKEFVERLKKEQHASGGWSQKPDMQPDAYATGTVLVALHEAGHV